MRKFKLASILVALTLTLSIAPACTKKITREEPRVYVLASYEMTKGIYYHQIYCRYEGKGATSFMSINQAQKKGYTACPLCKGIPTGTIKVTYEVNVFGCNKSCDDWLIERSN